MEFAQGMEAAEHNARKLKHGDGEQVRRMGPQRRNQGATKEKPRDKPCYRCGGTGNSATACNFKEVVCHKCQRRGHLAKVCRGGRPESRQTRQRSGDTTNTVQEFDTSPEEQVKDITFFMVDKMSKRKPIVIEMEVNGQQLPMELDTGAAVSLISTSTYSHLFLEVPLTRSKTQLTTYTGQKITVAGIMKVEVRYGGKVHDLQLHVVKGEGPSLLKRDWLMEVRLDWASFRVATVTEKSNRLEALLKQYQEVFNEGLGKMSSVEASLHLIPNATPKFLKARSVPYALREAIQVELERLEEAGVIQKVTHSK